MKGIKQEDNLLFAWLRYAIIIAMVAGLIATAFKAGDPPRNDFPVHTPRR